MISVCVATYNGEKFLNEQIDSILDQLGKDDELIISDDGSTDATLDIIRAYMDPRIKLLNNTQRHGVNGNFENALSKAKGDYIFLSDQDDIWLAGKVEKCIEALQNADLVLHNAIVVDKNKNEICNSLNTEINAKTGFINNLLHNSYSGCCMAFNKKVLDIILPLPVKTSFFHDQWIALNAERKFKTKIIDEKLILFRRHQANSSSAASKSPLSLLSKIKYRLALLSALIFR